MLNQLKDLLLLRYSILNPAKMEYKQGKEKNFLNQLPVKDLIRKD